MKLIRQSLIVLWSLILSTELFAQGSNSTWRTVNPVGVCRFGPYDSLYGNSVIISPNGWIISNINVRKGHLSEQNLADPEAGLRNLKGYRAIFLRDYKGIIGNNQNQTRVDADITFQSIENPEQTIKAKIQRRHPHFSRPYLTMSVLEAPRGIDLQHFQTRAQQQKCDESSGVEVKNSKPMPSVMTFNIIKKGRLSSRNPDPDVARRYEEDACDCFDSYYDTVYGFTFIIPPHNWTIASYEMVSGRHISTVKEPQGVTRGSFYVEGYRALIIHDKDQESWERSKVLITMRSYDGRQQIKVELSREEGWFSNGFIGKPEILMNVESQSGGVRAMDKLVSGPSWGYRRTLNSTRGVSPAAVTFVIERENDD